LRDNTDLPRRHESADSGRSVLSRKGERLIAKPVPIPAFAGTGFFGTHTRAVDAGREERVSAGETPCARQITLACPPVS